MTQVYIGQMALLVTQFIAHSRAGGKSEALASKRTAAIRAVVETTLRLSIVVDAFATVPAFIDVPPLRRRKYERWIEGDATRLAHLAQRILYGALAAESQVPLEEEVELEVIRKYLAQSEHKLSTSEDTWAFWDLVEQLNLECEEIDQMSEMSEIKETIKLFQTI